MNHSTLFALILLGAALSAPSLASADDVWATEATAATRWPEKDSKEVGSTEVGKKLELLFRDGDRLRVRVKGGTFGWVDASTVSDSAPEGAAPSLQLPPGLLKLAGEQGGLNIKLD